MMTQVYKELARLIQARLNCEQSNNTEWFDKHGERIVDIVRNYMPSGSGIDNGVDIDVDKSKPNRLVFYFGFHHMNDVGYYDSWTDYKAIVTPSLVFDFDLRITGCDRNQIKDYLHDVFNYALHQELEN